MKHRMHSRGAVLPGMQVRVVNSYAAASLSVSVTLFSKEDFPTDGKPVMTSDVM